MRTLLLLGALSSLVSLALGCADGGTDGSGGSGASTSSTGGSGGDGGSGATGGGAGTGGAGTGGAGTGGSAGTGGGTAADHLLISEVSVSPVAGEFLEIYNPTNATVALVDVYLSDNSTYVDLASGGAWSPITSNPGTDFLARFPANASIPPDGVIVIGFDTGYEKSWGSCPDYFVGTAPLSCGGNMVPTLLETEAGSITDLSNLSDSREMLVLFTWSGTTSDTLKDLDYVTWGDTFEAGTRVDKTGVAGYAPDTAPAQQQGAPIGMPFESIERCALETGEQLSGGNGISGHDETSESLGTSFVVQATPTPGTKNACL